MNEETPQETQAPEINFEDIKGQFLSRIENESEREVFAKPLQDIKSIDGLLNSFVHTKKELGRKSDQFTVRVPKPDADAKEWDEFYKKAGKPESPEEYDLAFEDYELTDDAAKEAREGLYQAGLNKKQAEQALKTFLNISKKGYEALEQQGQAELEAVTKYKLEKFGDKVQEVDNEIGTFLNQNFTKEIAEEINGIASKSKAMNDLLAFVAENSTPKDGANMERKSAFETLTPRQRIDRLWADKEFSQKYFRGEAKAVETMKQLQALDVQSRK